MEKVLKTGIVAVLCAILAGAAQAAGVTATFLKNSTTSATISLNGKWHRKHFTAAKNYAEKNGVPLIAVWSNGDACSHCTKFEKACNSTAFKNWMKTSGCVFYFTYPGDGSEGKMGDQNSVFKWIRQSQTSFPFVRIYWSVNGKKKVDVSTVGDTVDGNQPDAAGGKNAVAYLKKILKNYKYTPAPAVPKYTGGAFGVGDSDGDHLEAVVGASCTTSVDVPIVRTAAAVIAVASTNTLEIAYPDGTTSSETVEWAKGDADKTVAVAIPDSMTPATGRVTLTLLNAAGAAVATNHIWLVAEPENSPRNPLWIGEKSADELAWGEWTMDLDVAMAKVKAYNEGTGNSTSGNGPTIFSLPPPADRAYTLVLLEGSLWCPDCHNTDAYLFNTQKFKTWAQDRKVALVAIDVPYSAKEADISTALLSTSPTLLSYDTGTSFITMAPASGAAYLSRKMIDREAAAEVLENNIRLGFSLRLPNWTTNKNRPPVPSFYLVRDDGTVAARNQYFGSVKSPESSADIDAYIERLDEMLAQAEMPEEESNDDCYRTGETMGIRETIEDRTLSFADAADVYHLDPATTRGKRMNFTLTGDDNVILELRLVQMLSASSSIVLESASGLLTDGVSIGAEIPGTNCYISVNYMANGGVPADPRFAVARADSTLCPYTLSSDFVVEPTELARDNTFTIPGGGKTLSVALVSNQVYRITGLAAAGNEEVLEEVVGGTTDCLYLALADGDSRLVFDVSDVSIQKWNPGSVGFVVQRASVSESAVSYQIRVARTDGESGRATAELSFLADQTLYPDLVDLSEFQSGFTWEEGETDVREAKVILVENTFADGDQSVFFKADTGGDSVSAITNFTLVVRDNDKATPGRIAIAGATPAMSKSMTVFARHGEEVRISLERVNGATGSQSVALEATGGTLDTSALSWGNRITAAQEAVLTLPDSGSSVKVTVTPDKGSSVDASRRCLTINMLDGAVPGFGADSAVFGAMRYIPVDENVPLAAAASDATKVKLYSGALPPGVKWTFDRDGGKVLLSGTPSKAGSFTAVFRVFEGDVAGLTSAVTFDVTDPAASGKGDGLAEPLNPSVAAARTFSDITVLKEGTNLVDGVLTLTLPRNGRASAKLRSVEYGTVTLSCASWSAIAPDGTLSASLGGVAGGTALRLDVSAAPDGSVALAMEGRGFIVPDAAWSAANSAADFKGYYTAVLPYAGTLAGDAPAQGSGLLTLKMNTAAAVNAGKVTFSGYYPNGRTFSGSATLSAKTWLGELGCWQRAVLPVVSLASGETLAGALEITPGAWDVSATNMVDKSSGMCAGRCSYKAVRRSLRPAREAAVTLWRHIDKADAASGDIALDPWGTYYNSAENFVSCCQASHGTPNLTFFVLDDAKAGMNNTALLGDFAEGEVDATLFDSAKAPIAVTYAKATKTAKTKTSQVAKTKAATALSSFAFTLSTGYVSGAFKLDGVTFTYQGVVMPGWGSQDCTSCGYSVDVDGGAEAPFKPFISGTAWFDDTLEYVDAYGKTRTATVRRSTPFSVGVKAGE